MFVNLSLFFLAIAISDILPSPGFTETTFDQHKTLYVFLLVKKKKKKYYGILNNLSMNYNAHKRELFTEIT